MDNPDVSMTEELSFIDLLKPEPHHLHIWEDLHKGALVAFASCDCGWVGTREQTKYAAAEEYRDHIERPE